MMVTPSTKLEPKMMRVVAGEPTRRLEGAMPVMTGALVELPPPPVPPPPVVDELLQPMVARMMKRPDRRNPLRAIEIPERCGVEVLPMIALEIFWGLRKRVGG